jgi:hypothetical protein
VERHGAEGVGQRLLVPACAEPGVPSWGQGVLLVQRLLLLLLWPGQEAGRHVEAQCGHEGLRTLLSNGHGARVHSHVPLATGGRRSATVCWSCRRNQWGQWSVQKSHHSLHRHCCSCRCCRRHYRYCGFCCCTCSGCHRCRRFHHWAGKMAWKTVALLPGMQHWCRASSGQPEARHCPCESPPVADRLEL